MKIFTIDKNIELKAPIGKVFSALTNSDEIPKYFPLKSVESTWEVGGEVLYKGEVSGNPFTDYGVIEELSFPNTYRYRYWSDNHGTDKAEENFLTINYSLVKSSVGTRLSVKQSNIKSLEMYELINAGGEVLGAPMEIPGVGQYVSFNDTEGNRVSMIQPIPHNWHAS